MKPRSFLVLAGLTVLAVIAAILVVIDQPALTTLTKGDESAFEVLTERVNDAAELAVRSNEATFSIVKTDTGWGMKDRAEYPVHFDKVKTALVGLSELKLLEAKTSDPSRYKRLEVEEPDTEEAQSVRFEIKDAAGKSMASGLVGRLNPNLFGEGGGGTYLRRGKEEQSWLAAGEVSLGKTRNDWMVRDIVDIAAEKVRRAVIRQPEGAEVVVTQEKPDSREYKLEGIPEGRKLKDSGEAKNLAGGLWRLTFEDVKPAADIEFPPKPNVSVYETLRWAQGPYRDDDGRRRGVGTVLGHRKGRERRKGGGCPEESRGNHRAGEGLGLRALRGRGRAADHEDRGHSGRSEGENGSESQGRLIDSRLLDSPLTDIGFL